MKNLKKSKLILYGICFTLFLAVSGMWAYFSATGVIENMFSTSGTEISIIEVFDPSQQWLPGEKKQKEVKFKNNGSSDMLLRFRVDLKLEDETGKLVDTNSLKSGTGISINSDGIPVYNETPMFTVGWESYLEKNFTSIVKDGKTYYYYNKILSGKDETENVMTYVQFADWITGGNDGTTMDFQKYKAHVIVTGELLQVNKEAAREMWQAEYESSEDDSEIPKGEICWRE